MALLQVKIIKAKKMKLKQIRRKLIKTAERQGKINRKEYKKTVATWEGEKPDFQSFVTFGFGNITLTTVPVGGGLKAVEKFLWLDEGTKIRWAVMSGNWKSKTTPGKLASGRGRGRVVIAGRRAMQRRNIRPRPGIKAREWTETLRKQRRRPFTRAMIKATNRGLDRIYQ